MICLSLSCDLSKLMDTCTSIMAHVPMCFTWQRSSHRAHRSTVPTAPFLLAMFYGKGWGSAWDQGWDQGWSSAWDQGWSSDWYKGTGKGHGDMGTGKGHGDMGQGSKGYGGKSWVAFIGWQHAALSTDPHAGSQYAIPRAAPCTPPGGPKGPSSKGKSLGVLPGSVAQDSGKQGKNKGGKSGKGKRESNKGQSQEDESTKGKDSKPRQDMTPEEKKLANDENRQRVKRNKMATQLASKPEDPGWVEPKWVEGQFNVPAAHRLRKQPPRDLRKNCRGLVTKWKEILSPLEEQQGKKKKTERLKDLWKDGKMEQWAPQGKELAFYRRSVNEDILRPIGLDELPRVMNVQTKEGRSKMMAHALWPGGPALQNLRGDAAPNLPKLTTAEENQHIV